MSDNLRNYTKAIYAMDAVVNRASDSDWDAQSPCEAWTAREVLGHTIFGLKRVRSQAAGADGPAEMAEAEVAGANPQESWAEARDAVLAALDQPGALQTIVQGFGGEQPLDNSLQIMTMDVTVHTWDLATALNQTPVVPSDLAAGAYHGIKAFGDGARRPGIFDAEVATADDADIVTKMAGMAGRAC